MDVKKEVLKLRGLAVPLALLAVWWIITKNGWLSAVFLPPPETVVATFVKLVLKGKIFADLNESITKVAIGFLAGITAGFVLGTAMGLSTTIEKLFGPLFNAVRQVPILGWIPVLILIFGLTELTKIIFIALGAFYPMTLNTFDGCRQLKKEYLEVARVFEFNRPRLLWRFILPSAFPSILAGIRVSMSEAWMLVIGAEIFFKSRGGIGDLMWEAKTRVQMDIVFITILIIGLIGFILNYAMKILENRLLRWRSSN